MYTGAILPLRLERVFGVTTFELGWCPANSGDVVLSLLGMAASGAKQPFIPKQGFVTDKTRASLTRGCLDRRFDIAGRR
jgi:hypothetical protein